MTKQVHESDLEMMARLDREHYDSLPIHLKFLEHFGMHQWHDGEHWEIDCGFEWEDEEDIPNIHEISDWIESEIYSLPIESQWIDINEEKPEQFTSAR